MTINAEELLVFPLTLVSSSGEYLFECFGHFFYISMPQLAHQKNEIIVYTSEHLYKD